MPKMPEWATGARIVFDKQSGLAFVREGRRAHLEAYSMVGKDLVYIEDTEEANLDKARKHVMERIGKAVGASIMALHPHAKMTHMSVNKGYERGTGRYLGWVHLCGIDHTSFRSANDVMDVTCPVCLAVIREDVDARAKKVGVQVFEEAVEHVRAVRTINALGQQVNGEDATTRL